jgi:protein-L-isoaspartate(D-aspartate) O-methyltransferase
MALIDQLIKEKWLKTPEIIRAFRKIKREDFLPDCPGGREDKMNLSEINQALSIGFGQTISQPLTVAFMLELLQPKKGDKILDVGSGSGWTTALLAEIVGKSGKVISIEIIPELSKFGKNNINKYSFIKEGIVEHILGDGSKGFKKMAPYDKILASASGEALPEQWKKQLKIKGKIVCPIKDSIWLFVKKSENEFHKKEYPGFVFVPLV